MGVVGDAEERLDRREGGIREDGNKWYRRVYLVEVDDKGDGALTVLTATGLPQQFYSYTTDNEVDVDAIVRSLEPRQLSGHWKYWEVEVNYDTELTTSNPNREQNPLLWEPRVYSTTQTVQVPVIGTLKAGQQDPEDPQYNEAIEDSAGNPFDPQPMVDDAMHGIVIERNEVSFNNPLAIEYTNAVNEDPWAGAAPRQARIVQFTTTGRTSVNVDGNMVYYYPVRYVILYKRETWDVVGLDQGPKYWTGGSKNSGKEVPFLDDKDMPKIGKLNGSGGANAAAAADQWVRKRHYKEKIFGLLNLPTYV
jgi:hypothetical protein